MVKKIFLFIICFLFFIRSVSAAEFKTNKVGIGVLSPEEDIEDATKMVNNNGDWGWMVLVIKRGDANLSRWQDILDKLAKNRVIPIIRIATNVDTQGNWSKPNTDDANYWADFLSKLYFPTKYKYIQIYNEVNTGKEWGGSASAQEYTNVLLQTIGALKSKDNNFVVLNSPLDLSVTSAGGSVDARVFLAQMNDANPDVFRHLDGWASHSYPNPNFSALPTKSGRTGIDGYRWELAQVANYIAGKKLPVFITETGWKRDKLTDEEIGKYYEYAFTNIWNDPRVVAVCPFVFSYPSDEFYEFSFKNRDNTNKKYFSYYDSILNLKKVSGEPEREDKISYEEDDVPSVVVSGVTNTATVKYKNVGNYVWQKGINFDVSADSNMEILSLEVTNQTISPSQDVIINVKFKAPLVSSYNLKLDVHGLKDSLDSRVYNVQSVNYVSYILKSIKNISFGGIFYSSAKIMRL